MGELLLTAEATFRRRPFRRLRGPHIRPPEGLPPRRQAVSLPIMKSGSTTHRPRASYGALQSVFTDLVILTNRRAVERWLSHLDV